MSNVFLRNVVAPLIAVFLWLLPAISSAAEISCTYLATSDYMKKTIQDRDQELAQAAKSMTPKRDLHLELRYDAWEKVLRQYPNKDFCGVALIKGRIVAGDADNVLAFMKNEPLLWKIQLWSMGGSLIEAIRIGEAVRKLSLTTEAPFELGGNRLLTQTSSDAKTLTEICKGKECLCASACFVIWAGGVERIGTALGIHRPSLEEQYLGSLSIHDAEEQWKKIVQRTKQYLEKMEIPEKYISVMFSTDKNSIYVLGDDRTFDPFSHNGMTGYPISVDEWVAASCDRLSPSEIKDFNGNIGSEGYRKYLETKFFQTANCESYLLTVARARNVLNGVMPE